MTLTKRQTKILQGIAILFMLGLHLFNRTDTSPYYDVHLYIGEVPLLTVISYVFDSCVPIYLFCSGYGLFRQMGGETTPLKARLRRIAGGFSSCLKDIG